MADKEQKSKERAEDGSGGGKTAAMPAPRLKKRYRDEMVAKLKEQFGYTSVMQVPKLDKIVINMGTGSSEKDPKHLENSLRDMTLIAGQKPVTTSAKKAISNFKLRQGMKIGCKVTLRGVRMYAFLDKFFNVVLPRIRDFRGTDPKSFDRHGNYSLGLKEQLIFPEIDYDKVDKPRGMDVTIVTTAKTDKEAAELLKLLGLPFREN